MKSCLGVVAIIACFSPTVAFATNGTNPTGIGMKAKGMGGVAVAMDQDALGGATNPASFAFVGNRIDVGLDLFLPTRSAQRTGSGGFGAGSLDASVKSGTPSFLIPEMGIAHQFGNWGTGLTIVGSGGMNTDYPGGTLDCGGGPGSNILCGQGPLGIDLQQLIVAPGVAYKFGTTSIGVAPQFAYQRFKAEGLQAFDNPPGFPPFTSQPGSVTNNGYDSSSGSGLRVGVQSVLEEKVTVGFSYVTEIAMSKFDKYDGLIAGGRLDIPAALNAGVAARPIEDLTIAVEYAWIFYSDVPAFANSSSAPGALGEKNGKAFGWSDLRVWKFGAEYRLDRVALRAGYNYGENPIDSSEVTVNILAPAVTQRHVSAGATVNLGSQEITLAYIHTFENRVKGSSFFNGFGPGVGGDETIEMSQNSIGLAWGWRM